jgi:hypothetical protein
MQVYMFELSMFDINSMEIIVRTTNTFMKRLAVQNKLSLLLKIFGLKKIHNNYFQSTIKSVKKVFQSLDLFTFHILIRDKM